MPKKPAAKKTVETLKHKESKRRNIPTAEFQSVLKTDQQQPIELRWPRNPDLDPQLVWRGKDELDAGDLVVYAPPLYIQEKVQPKVLIDDLLRADARAQGRQRTDARPVRRLQRHSEGRRQDRVLPARPELVEPHDPRRLPPGHGQPRRARGAARQGAVHLHRSAVRDQVQLELPVVDDEPRREGRQARRHHPRARAGEGLPRHVADGIHTYLDLPSRPPDRRARPADRDPARSSCRSATRTSIACGR